MAKQGYWVCLAEPHKSVLEILEEKELNKFQEVEGGYRKVGYASSKDDALDLCQRILEEAYALLEKEAAEDAHLLPGQWDAPALKKAILRLFP